MNFYLNCAINGSRGIGVKKKESNSSTHSAANRVQQLACLSDSKALAKNQITTRLFVGFLFSKELKIQLLRNIAWKQARILQQSLENGLRQIHYENNEYIGCYLVGENANMLELKENDMRLRKVLQDYCPEFDIEVLQLFIFPQIFVT